VGGTPAHPAAMTLHEETRALQLRIARAEVERDAWKTAGLQEKYLEAYSMVEALQLQLDRLHASAVPALLRAPRP
jgi:hypothetical protein